MKRIISVLLSLVIIFTGVMAYADDMNAQFSISAIENNYDGNYLTMNITLPYTVDGGTLIIALYTDGVCTKVITRDVSTKNKFSLEQTYSITPDTIKLMIWEKGRIKPLSSSQNGLNAVVYQKANKNVLSLLNDLPSTIKALRALLRDYSNTDEITEARIKSEITALLDAIDSCADKAQKGGYGQNELLTSEYCKREFREELKGVEDIFSKTSDDAKALLNDFYSSKLDTEFPDGGYSRVISNFMGFFDINLIGR